MRQLLAGFARLEERYALGLSVPLGRVDLSPELAELQNGERVLVVAPGSCTRQPSRARSRHRATTSVRRSQKPHGDPRPGAGTVGPHPGLAWRAAQQPGGHRLGAMVVLNGGTNNTMQELRQIMTDLWPLEKRSPDFGIGVFLNLEDADDMNGLTEGEYVKLVERPELVVEDAIVHKIKVDDGRVFWFAEIGDREAIKVIYQAP